MSGPVLVWEHLGGGLRSAARRPAGTCERRVRRRRLRRASDGLQPLERAFRRPARCRAAARDPGQLRVVQPRLRAARPGRAPVSMCRRPGRSTSRRARAVVDRTGGRMRGFGQRGTGAWHTMYTGFATQFWSYGGARFRRRPLRDRDARVDPRDRRLPRRRCATPGPRDWLDQRWYELALDFARGRYGLIVDSDHYVAYFEEPAHSELVGEIGYAPPPARSDRPAPAEPLDLVGRHEHPRAGRDAGLAVHRVGDSARVPAPVGLRGQHESDSLEHLGRRALPRAHVGLGRVLRRRAHAHRARCVRPGHADPQVSRDREPVGRGAARRLRRASGAHRGAPAAAADIDELVVA